MATAGTNQSECLLCGSRDKISRGLCDRHYRRFNAKYKKLAEENGTAIAEEFERISIAKGLVLPRLKGGKPRDYDPFDVVAKIVVAESSGEYTTAEIAKMVAECEHVIQRATAKRVKKPPTNATENQQRSCTNHV